MKGLQGKNILVTRGESQASPFIDMIQEEGGVCYHTPLLTFQLNESESHQKILHQLHDFSWVFLTSSNGVKFFFQADGKIRKRDTGKDEVCNHWFQNRVYVKYVRLRSGFFAFEFSSY